MVGTLTPIDHSSFHYVKILICGLIQYPVRLMSNLSRSLVSTLTLHISILYLNLQNSYSRAEQSNPLKGELAQLRD